LSVFLIIRQTLVQAIIEKHKTTYKYNQIQLHIKIRD
jgi:hypothetical protein